MTKTTFHLKVSCKRLCRVLAAGALLTLLGCNRLHVYNSAAWIEKPKFYNRSSTCRFLKYNYFYPVRDAFNPQVWASLYNKNQPPAWDVDASGQVPDGSCYVNRDLSQISPDQAADGPTIGPPPLSPWKVVTPRPGKKPTSFIGEDATGRRFMVKLDDPDYPEAQSAAAVVTTRILWLLGYHVPADYVVTIAGTGVPDYDGRRAEASEFIPGKLLKPFKFDALRYRREMRGLRLVSAWLDDVDRCDNNTLVVSRNDRPYFYLLDFDSTLGLWKGRPKPVQRGHCHVWDPPWMTIELLSLGGLSRSQIRHHKPVSTAIGVYYADDFDPSAWKGEQPNTAFRFMSQADTEWIIRKIAQITPEQIQAIVKVARFSNPEDEDHLYRTLLERRRKILDLSK